MMPDKAPLNLRLALFHLQCQAKEQLANYELMLVNASTPAEAEICRSVIKRLRRAIFDSEANGPHYHVGTRQ